MASYLQNDRCHTGTALTYRSDVQPTSAMCHNECKEAASTYKEACDQRHESGSPETTDFDTSGPWTISFRGKPTSASPSSSTCNPTRADPPLQLLHQSSAAVLGRGCSTRQAGRSQRSQ